MQMRHANARVLLALLTLLAVGASPRHAGAQIPPNTLPNQIPSAPGGLVAPIVPIPAPNAPPVPQVQLPPPSSQRYVSPACQIPMASRSADLRAYCAAMGQ
jgi:hypothetical protein